MNRRPANPAPTSDTVRRVRAMRRVISSGESLRVNIATGALPRGAGIAIQLLLSPFIVAEIGLAAFGYWSLLLGAAQYLLIADGGLPVAALRNVAASRTRGNADDAHSAVLVTLAALFAMGTLVTLCGVAVVMVMPASLAAGLPEGWELATATTGGSVGLMMIANGLASVPRGHERWDLQAVTLIVSQLAGAVCVVVVLLLGGGLGALGVASLGAPLISVIGFALQARHLEGLRFKRSLLRMSTLRGMRREGVNLQIVMFVGATNAQADRFMLLPFASLSWIGAYALGSRVATALRMLPVTALAPLMVRVARIEAEDGWSAVKAFYSRALDIACSFGVAPLVLLSGAAFPATLAWLGDDYTISATAASLLGVGYAVNFATGPGTVTAIACRRADLDRDYNVLGLALNLALSLILGLIFGGWGVVVATVCGLSISSLWLLRRVDRWLDVQAVRSLLGDTRLRRRFVASTVTAGGAVAVTLWLDSTSRLENLAVASAAVLVGLVIVGGGRILPVRSTMTR